MITLENIQNIPLVRRGAIGDIIFTLTAYYLLRANFPGSRISYLMRDNYSHVLQSFSDLDEVLLISQKNNSTHTILKLWNFSRQLYHGVRQRNLQLAIDFVGHGEHAALLWLCKIKHRWASIKNERPAHQLFSTNHFIRNFDDTDIADQHLKLLEKSGLTPMYYSNKENEARNYIFRHSKILFYDKLSNEGIFNG